MSERIPKKDKNIILHNRPTEPVASPQATSDDTCPDGSWAGPLGTRTNTGSEYVSASGSIARTNEGEVTVSDDVSRSAAQSAVGTTLHDHKCGVGGRHSLCICTICKATKPAAALWPSEGTKPQAERPDYRDVACKYCRRLRVQQSGICEKCQWDNDLGNFASVTGRCPHSSDGKHKPVPGNNIMGAAFTECEFCKVELPEARAVAPVETPDDIPTHFVKWEDAKKGEDGVYRVPTVETRLTAEQFADELEETLHDLSGATFDLLMHEAIKHKLEAFRDKGVADVIEEQADAFENQRQEISGLREEIERLKREGKRVDADADRWMGRAATAETKVEGLRAKLAEQERLNKESMVGESNCEKLRVERATKRHWQERAEAAEAEVAALRERERWISVEEKLPSPGDTFRVWYESATGWCEGIAVREKGERAAIRRYSDGHEINLTHWKALSAAPVKDGK